MKQGKSEDFSLGLKLLTAGTAACIADLATFPLDTAKVRMQVSSKNNSRYHSCRFPQDSFLSFTIEIIIFFKIAGEGQALLLASAEGSVFAVRASQPGLFQTIGNIVRIEGARYVVHYPNDSLRDARW